VRESGFDIQRVIELIAERKIEEAMQRASSTTCPGKGKPLPLDEEWFAPPELRPAIRLLKSAGVLPDWMERAREIERCAPSVTACGASPSWSTRARRRWARRAFWSGRRALGQGWSR
jgi:Domain of unknown function (DUF1992).